MKYKNYYDVLGVAKDATLDEIKKSYRKLAHQYHPDVSKDPKGEEKFKEVAEAYATLKDKEKRAAYDQLGQLPPGEEFRPPPDWGSQNTGQGYSFDDLDLSDIFSNFSRSQQRARSSTPGQDYELATTVSLEQAYQGSTIDLHFTVQEIDHSGHAVKVKHEVKTRIPRGITPGQRLVLRGKGGKGSNGGPDGNLNLVIQFLPHSLFKVSGHDLLIDLPITPWEASLGASVKVPTLQGMVNLKVPPGTNSGQKLRISKKGMPKKGGEFGDLYAIVQIAVPPNLSPEERQIFEKLAGISTFNPRLHFEESS